MSYLAFWCFVVMFCLVFSGMGEAAGIIVEPSVLDGHVGGVFAKEFVISSSTSDPVTDIAIDRTSWNGLTLSVQSSGKITVSGTPSSVGSQIFNVSGKIDGNNVPTAPFMIQILEVSPYFLSADPDWLRFTTNASAISRVKITSNSGIKPTDLTPSNSLWNGLTITASDSNSTVVVEGTPLAGAETTITVAGKVNGIQVTSATFLISVRGEGDEGGNSCNLGGLSPWLSLLVVPYWLSRRKK